MLGVVNIVAGADSQRAHDVALPMDECPWRVWCRECSPGPTAGPSLPVTSCAERARGRTALHELVKRFVMSSARPLPSGN